MLLKQGVHTPIIFPDIPKSGSLAHAALSAFFRAVLAVMAVFTRVARIASRTGATCMNLRAPICILCRRVRSGRERARE